MDRKELNRKIDGVEETNARVNKLEANNVSILARRETTYFWSSHDPTQSLIFFTVHLRPTPNSNRNRLLNHFVARFLKNISVRCFFLSIFSHNSPNCKPDTFFETCISKLNIAFGLKHLRDSFNNGRDDDYEVFSN